MSKKKEEDQLSAYKYMQEALKTVKRLYWMMMESLLVEVIKLCQTWVIFMAQ